jgi:hypothetical protein
MWCFEWAAKWMYSVSGRLPVQLVSSELVERDEETAHILEIQHPGSDER